MNPLYSQSYAHYNTQPQSLQPPPQWQWKLVIGWSHIWKFGGLHLLAHSCALSVISESMVHRHQMQATATSTSWHTMYWIFIGAGLYKMAMAIDQRSVLRSTRIATYLVLDRCSSLHSDNKRGHIVHGERLTAVPSSLTCIERHTGPIVVRCEYSRICCHSKSKVQQLHASMVPWRRPQSGFV